MYVALLFLIGIFKVSCQSFCQTSAEKNDLKVATFCQNSVASGSSAIIDGYAAHGTDTDKTCTCSTTVSIPNNGTSSLAFSALFSLHPQYIGCGSSIGVRVNNSGQSTRIRCTIAGSITVNNGDNVLIELKKESSPEDTRYCMKLQFSDPTATLIVNCNGENVPVPPTPPTTTVLTQSSISSSNRTEARSTSTLSSTTSQNITNNFTSSNPIISSTTEVASSSSDSPTLKTNSSTIISTTVLETSSTTKANVENNMSTSTTTNTYDEMSSNLPESGSTTDNSTLSSMDEKYTTTMQMLTDGDITSQTEQLLTKLTTMADTTVIETRTPTLIKQTTTSLTKTVSTPTSTQSPTSTATTSTASTSTSIKTTSQLYEIESTTDHGISAKANKSSTEELKKDETTVAVRLTSPEKRSTKDERSTQTSQTTPQQTTQMPGDTGSSKDDDIPIEVVAPVASVGGLIIVCVIICIVVGIRRNGCGCTEDTLPHSNTLVEKASTEIKNREKDTYVNPLYDDISLTGKSDRSDRDSMMQEIPSDDDSDDSYRLPESTKIDGELWTHL
ncbi:location of vulva defective 1-like isoform X2 [Mytilus californianus]|uniref:location of vulva defective 1-like isoform X2 n=1 Tax=Mytilus californianus TaxID=6549 RepID=UPI002247B1AE|nr:location of vulva defective 1-like isoform X2 [Mytilus californianus]